MASNNKSGTIRRSDDDDLGSTGSGAAAKIDLQALAEEVYQLLKKELKLERERRGWRNK